MSDLFAVLYPDPHSADSAMEALEKLSRAGTIELTDACAVVKDANGRVKLHQENNLYVIGALGGLALGTILGWFVLLPYLGVPAALLGAAIGKFTDFGLDDNKMKDLSKEMKPNSSALFMLMRGPEIDIVLKDLARFGGRIFYTSLDKYQEDELEEKLEELRNMYQKEAEHPLDIRSAVASAAPKKEETEIEVVVTKEILPNATPDKKYRLVWYYSQWPQGNEYDILASGLTREEAELLKEKKDPHLKGEILFIEEENEKSAQL